MAAPSPKPPGSFLDLIGRFETIVELSRLMHVHYETAKKWRDREYVQPEHWPRLIEVAHERGIEVTTDMLTSWTAEVMQRRRREAAGAA